MKKNKKELIKWIENQSEEDFKYYILVSDIGVHVELDNKVETMTLITSFLNMLFQNDILNERDIDKMCELAKLSDKELVKKAKDLTEKGSKLEDLLEELLDKMEEL